jgi:hypothetical protein
MKINLDIDLTTIIFFIGLFTWLSIRSYAKRRWPIDEDKED